MNIRPKKFYARKSVRVAKVSVSKGEEVTGVALRHLLPYGDLFLVSETEASKGTKSATKTPNQPAATVETEGD